MGRTPAEAASPGYNGRIAFSSDRAGNYDVYSMRPDGNGLVQLTTDPAMDLTPSWSPDGRRIAFTTNRDGNNEVYVMGADGANQTRLTTTSADDQRPDWSPDGTTLVFSSDRDGNVELYTMALDGTGVTRLTSNTAADMRPAWSPDGRKIAFASMRDNGVNPEIYVMDADGTNQTRLTSTLTVNDDRPSWSPDGTRLIFYSTRDGNNELYAMDADGTNVVRLTTNATTDYNPSWSPDGQAVIFTAQRDGNREIYRAQADGSGQTRLTSDPLNDDQAVWQPVPNTAPVAVTDTLTVPYNTPLRANVLANDADEEALSGTYLTITTAPAHGTAIVETGTINFTPNTGYVGPDQLTYQICDSFLLDQRCATAVLGITVQAPGTPAPVAKPALRSVGTVTTDGSVSVYYTGHRPIFVGTADPGSTVKVEIHSVPMMVTTTSDAFGNWSAIPTEAIPNGGHTVTITAAKNGATSEALSFVLGINTGLASTGTPILPLSAVAVATFSAAYVALRRRLG